MQFTQHINNFTQQNAADESSDEIMQDNIPLSKLDNLSQKKVYETPKKNIIGNLSNEYYNKEKNNKTYIFAMGMASSELYKDKTLPRRTHPLPFRFTENKCQSQKFSLCLEKYFKANFFSSEISESNSGNCSSYYQYSLDNQSNKDNYNNNRFNNRFNYSNISHPLAHNTDLKPESQNINNSQKSNSDPYLNISDFSLSNTDEMDLSN